MAKQTNDSDLPALAAFEKLWATLGKLVSSREEHGREFREIEKPNMAGVPAVVAEKPGGNEEDIEGAAYGMLNGAAIQAAPTRKSGEGAARLYELDRLLRIEDRAIQLARYQITVAAGAASKEAVDNHRDEILAAQRDRALCVLTLLSLNEKIESLRAKVSIGGATPDFPLDGFSGRLFGRASDTTSPVGHWARQYLTACVKAGVISEKESKR